MAKIFGADFVHSPSPREVILIVLENCDSHSSRWTHRRVCNLIHGPHRMFYMLQSCELLVAEFSSFLQQLILLCSIYFLQIDRFFKGI